MSGKGVVRRPRIAVYGGSFDPVHNGHLVMAVFARDAFALDRVLFVPARRSPFKQHAPVLADTARLALLEAAVAGEPGLAVSACELGREPPSYMLDTLLQLRAGPEADWFLLVGMDQVPGLPAWHGYDSLRALLAGILVAPRFDGRAAVAAPPDDPLCHVLDAPAIGISSTLVRTRLAAGLGVRGLIPDAVHERIIAEGWYRHGS